jgi:hypothetical protein
MERGVVYAALRDAGQYLEGAFDAYEVRGVMKRRKFAALAGLLDDGFGYYDRMREYLGAMDHAVTDGVYLFLAFNNAVVGMQQVIDDLLDGDLMVFYRKRFFDLVLAEDLII